MKRRITILLVSALLASAVTGCFNTDELEPIKEEQKDNKICFTENGLEEIAQAVTKTTATTSATLVSDGFYVSATTGSAGSESESWTNAHFTKSGDTWIGDKYWPASNPSYHFYASNAQLTFNAAGATVNANSNTDVVCAYLPESNYKTLNTLVFKHIFARLCRIDVAAQTGYTISNINVRITPKVSGTYNLRTGAGQTDGTGWSSTVNGSQQTVANTTGANNNDIYMVPGRYTITVSWTATASGASTNYTDKSVTIPVYGGHANNLSLVLGSEINFGIDLQDYCNYDYRDNLDYLTFYSPEAQTITIFNSDPDIINKELQYSTNQGQTWTTIISNQSSVSFSCNAGDIIWLKSNDTNPTANELNFICFQFQKDTYVYGNVNSLINNSNTLTGMGFMSLFYNQTHLKTYQNKKISLPATTLAIYCYYSMFSGCTSLTTAPELPATTLANRCYYQMFSYCTSLTTAPELPATTLANNCYVLMFDGCTSLTIAPELPATTLASSCYSSMFSGCTSLTTAPELPATTLAIDCYDSMFQGCTSLTTAPELPATTLAGKCYDLMFDGCTSLTTAPELPTTTLAEKCYQAMFRGCTSLTTAPELPATTLAEKCYDLMFDGCTSLNYIKANFTTTPSNSYTGNWVNNVAPTGTFVKNHNASWNVTGNNGVPTGWTVTNDLRGVENGHEWVDLGLRLNGNKILFATCNVGADRPEAAGTYYPWGWTKTNDPYYDHTTNTPYTNIYWNTIQGYTFDWEHCPFHTGSGYNSGWSKYIPTNKQSYWAVGEETPDGKTTLDPEDDIAHVLWGGRWRMPDREELQLMTDWDHVNFQFNMILKALEITGKGEFADSYIFLPAAGFCYTSVLDETDHNGYYWSRSLDVDTPYNAGLLYFEENDYWITEINNRHLGCSVRPVLVLPE